jgi:hypothetical protein
MKTEETHEELTVPNELMELYYESEANKKLVSVYAKLPFGYKKAKKCSIDSQRQINQFWREITGLYNLNRNKVWSLDIRNQEIIPAEQAETND